jgi:hypothetical protein
MTSVPVTAQIRAIDAELAERGRQSRADEVTS